MRVTKVYVFSFPNTYDIIQYDIMCIYIYVYMYPYIWNPLMTLVLVGKGLVSGDLTFQTRDPSWALGIYT